MKLKDAIIKWENMLSTCTPSFKQECAFLCNSLLGLSKADMLTLDSISVSDYKKVLKAIKKRKKHIPLQLIIGETDFLGVKIKESKHILSPRPETEYMTSIIIDREDKSSSVLDMCSGSGCIGLALKKAGFEEVTLVDVSKKAIKLSYKNAINNGLNVIIVKSNMFENIMGQYDIITCNPPYIKRDDIKTLQTEVQKYDPKIALDGGDDGLDFYKTLANNAHKFLTKNGVMYLEIGLGQEKDIVKLLQSHFKNITIIKDLNGINRIVRAEK